MNDPFAKAKEFLAAFDHVRKNGFFEMVNCKILASVGKVFLVHIQILGYVPHDQKYMAQGCGVLVDPVSIVVSCKGIVKNQKLKMVKVEVKTEDWLLFDESGNEVIGSKGTETNMSIFVQFDP